MHEVSQKHECSECKGTGFHEKVPEYFFEDGGVVAKYKQADGTYRYQTFDEYCEDMKNAAS